RRALPRTAAARHRGTPHGVRPGAARWAHRPFAPSPRHHAEPPHALDVLLLGAHRPRDPYRANRSPGPLPGGRGTEAPRDVTDPLPGGRGTEASRDVTDPLRGGRGTEASRDVTDPL